MTVQTQPNETPQLAAALQMLAAGISVIPVRADGSKAPALGWKEYQSRPATMDEISGWYSPGSTYGVGAVTGTVSGNLEMTEIEGRGAHALPRLAALAEECGVGALWRRLCTGWLERSPSGGLHWFYRVAWPEGATPPGNTVLATRPSTPEELAANPGQRKQVIAETRGEGGYVVTAPSNGTCHPSGAPWLTLTGGPAAAPTITPEEREDFHAIFGTLHHEPPAPEPPRPTELPARRGDGLSPGDDYEARTDWADILRPHGWTYLFARGNTRYWRRPGKTIGQSASTGRDPGRDRLFVFTSSTEFEQLVPYTKFGATTVLNHGGDYRAAAAELRRQGYGDPEPPQAPSLRPFDPAPQAAGKPEGPRSYLDGSFDAAWLMQQEFAPLRYVVKDLIAEGLTIFAGAPKTGKSWLVLGIGLAVSSGQPALGCIATESRPVLYLALEDGKRRLQSRLAALGATKPSPNLTFITTAPSADIVHAIAEFFNAHPGEAPIVIIDTLGKAMRPAAGGETQYERDYKVVGGLKAQADAHPGSSIIVVHHTRKAERSDFLDAVSGTQGIAGAADTVLVLRRARGEATGTLSATSRDTKEGEYQVNVDDTGRWTLEGGSIAAAAEAEHEAKATYGVGDRMAEVIQAIHRHPEGIAAKDLKVLLPSMAPGDVDTYLYRAWNKNRIRRVKRGLYAPIPAVSLHPSGQNPAL